MYKDAPLEIKVWGDFACFTRPEMKAERVSYPVMTPSAARGILEAVFWKPEFSWRVREIHILSPILHFSILRNEIKDKMSQSVAKSRLEKGKSYYAEDSRHRTQRHTLALRDVAYLIKADVSLRPDVGEDPAKYRDQFRRRVAKGRCHHTPYFGCREFSAFFCEPADSEKPIDLSDDLGLMLFDLSFSNDSPGRGIPHFFNARLDHGILHVPQEFYSELE